MLRATVFALTSVLLTSAAAAQVVPMPPRDRPPHGETLQVGTAAIKGRVVDGHTGTAVARARVRLLGPGIQPPLILTDESGIFAFTALPRGSYSLMAEKTGYLPGRYPETGQTFRSSSRRLTVADGQVFDGVTVALFRGSAVTGRVVDAQGDPVEHANVQALRLPRSGGGRPQMRGGAATNDLGEFRLAHLEPGKYLILVVPSRTTFGPGPLDGAETQPVTTFFPGVPSIDQAQPVTVERGGSVTGLEMTLIDGVAVLVTGTVVDASGQPMSRNASVVVRPVSREMPIYASGTGTGVRPDGTFQVRVSPGEYDIEAHAMQPGISGAPGPGTEQFGRVRLAVGGDVSGVTIVLGNGAKITGRLVFDGTSPVPSLTELTANPRSPGVIAVSSPDGAAMCRAGQTHLAPDGTFTVDGVSGTCLARPSGNFGRWSVKSIVHDGKDLMDQPITLEPGQQLRDVQVTLTDRRTELTFRVVDEHEQPTREYVALVFPIDRTRWTESSRYIRPFVPPSSLPQQMTGYVVGSVLSNLSLTVGPGPGPDGVVVTGGVPSAMAGGMGMGSSPPTAVSGRPPDALGGLPPGEYYAVALDDLEFEVVRDLELLDRLSREATRVTLTDDVKIEVNLRRIKLAGALSER